MKLTPGSTEEERDNYWTKIIIEARRSPLGVAGYLRSKDLEINNYYRYFKKLRKFHPEWADLQSEMSHRAMKTKALKRAALPKTEVKEKASRRRFSAQDKRRILDEIDSANPGQGAAIMRREGIYSSQVHLWRAEREKGSLEAKKRGPKPQSSAQEVQRLKAQLAKSEKKLAQAHALIEFQKKMSEILKTMQQNADED